MESTMRKYAERIARNEVDPHIRYDGITNGLILDPLGEEVPLEVMGFGIYKLGPDFITKETQEKEMVLVPQEGEFEAEVKGERFSGERKGGPFSVGPGRSNASALYVPCNARLKIRGKGEVAFFEAPAFAEKPPFYFSRDQVTVVSRGGWVWRRDVVSLISPKDVSTNLIVGETYSPPGLWSGTPLHRHDRDEPLSGESDHEEIYFHRFRWKKAEQDLFGPYGVQVLMDEGNLKKAFLIGDKSVFAIPGGCHPVVASPVSELLYLWGLAGRGGALVMKDLAEFLHLKYFEEIFTELEGVRAPQTLSKERLTGICDARSFTREQIGLLEAMLKEKGYEIR